MRVFVAGASGVLGRRLLPKLLAAGHEVVGMARSQVTAGHIRQAGAEAAVCDAFDADALRTAVAAASPEAVVHQLTALPRRINPRTIERDFEPNDRLRRDGTRNLVSAAQAAGARRIVAQSIAFAYAPTTGLHGEDDPLFLGAAPPFRRSVEAIADLERHVLGAHGVVLRYGYFYGPGSSFARDGSIGEDVARRRFPLVGGGQGVWSFIHVDDAADATVAALALDGPLALNIVDDEPAPVARWLPELARALGAPPPRRVPAWLARLAAGSYGVTTMTRAQGSSNARAKEALGWHPAHASWRQGFAEL